MNISDDAVEAAHTLWCAGNHEGPCRRGQATGTEAPQLSLIAPDPETRGEAA